MKKVLKLTELNSTVVVAAVQTTQYRQTECFCECQMVPAELVHFEASQQVIFSTDKWKAGRMCEEDGLEKMKEHCKYTESFLLILLSD